jgi:hypothetical protein
VAYHDDRQVIVINAEKRWTTYGETQKTEVTLTRDE